MSGLQAFLRLEAASGVVLLVCAGFALACANSALADAYAGFWRTTLGLELGGLAFHRSLEWVVNDGLMVLFFFSVGLEIRRELQHGELSELRRATLPLAAALGGMLVPAAVYSLVANVPAARPGWGIPMATDIAFALGLLSLLGKRVPVALRVLLLTLAVIDDLGAICVIALAYSNGLEATGIAVALAGFGGVLALQRLGVKTKLAYVPLGLVAWAGVYAAGVHPTLAGVVLGLLTPVHALPAGGAARPARSPADALLEDLHPWVTFVIMPLFALANAGVKLEAAELDGVAWRVVLGSTLGLTLGKPLGILLACRLAVDLGLSRLPPTLGWRHVSVLGAVAGVGFTMALFIAPLAFPDGALLAPAKVGVLAGSGLASALALLLGRALLPAAAAEPSVRSNTSRGVG